MDGFRLIVFYTLVNCCLPFKFSTISKSKTETTLKLNYVNSLRIEEATDIDSIAIVNQNIDTQGINREKYSTEIFENTIIKSDNSIVVNNIPKKRKSRSSTIIGLGGKGKKKNNKKSDVLAMYRQSNSVPNSLLPFISEIHKLPRITPEEEIRLGMKSQQATHLENIYDELKAKLDREPSDSEWCTESGIINVKEMYKMIEEGSYAKERLVLSNLRMVQSIVNLYIRNGLGSEYNVADMMQEGMVGLIHAAKKFDPHRGYRFSTYAMYSIRASVKRSHMFQSRILRIPDRHHEIYKKAQLKTRDLECELGRKCSNQEVADELNIPLEKFEKSIEIMQQKEISLDAQLSNPNQKSKLKESKVQTMYEILDEVEHNCEYRSQDQKLVRDDLLQLLDEYLTPFEVEIVLLRYGLIQKQISRDEYLLGEAKIMTFKKIGQVMNIKPLKARSIYNSSMERLKSVIGPEWKSELL